MNVQSVLRDAFPVASIRRTTPYGGGTWGIIKGDGSIQNNALGNHWKQIYHEYFPTSKEKQKELPTMERYLDWNEKTDHAFVTIEIPIE